MPARTRATDAQLAKGGPPEVQEPRLPAMTDGSEFVAFGLIEP